MPTIILSQSKTETSAKTGNPPHHTWWQFALEAVFYILLAIGVLELFFAACGVGQSEFLQPDAQLGVRHIPGKVVTWRLEGFSNDRLNSLGLRDVEHKIEKPAGIQRIALLGDSSTEGLQVPLSETYGRVLEQQLNGNRRQGFEVINFATSSFGTGQEYVQFKTEVAKYKPDLTVVLYNRSDSQENVRDPRNKNVEPRPYFYLDSTGRLQQDNQLMANLANGSWTEKLFSFLRQNSRTYGVICQTDLSLSIHEKLYRKLKGAMRSLFSLGSKSRIHATASYPKQDDWAVTECLLKALNYECQLNGGRLLVMIFPNTLSDPTLAQESLKLMSLSKNEGFTCIDLSQTFLQNKDINSLFLQFHFSNSGHRLVANELKRHLEKLLLAKPSN